MARKRNFSEPLMISTFLSVLLFISLSVTSTECKTQTLEIIGDSNWTMILKDEWLVKFYAPWCPACRNLETTWKSLGDWAKNRDIRVGDVDVTEQSALSGRFMITALPTVYHVKDGEFRSYTGPRTLDDFVKFVDNEEWKNVSPVSSWKSPDSYLMSSISSLFQFSVKLKDVHSLLTDVYGLPVWVSFVLFGIVIILLGLLLGMVLVLVTDYFFGPPGEQADNEMIVNSDEVDTPGDEERAGEGIDEDGEEDGDGEEHVEDITPEGTKDTSVRKRTVAND